jgi:hypothetical protein
MTTLERVFRNIAPGSLERTARVRRPRRFFSDEQAKLMPATELSTDGMTSFQYFIEYYEVIVDF